jgi:hypothetical protein
MFNRTEQNRTEQSPIYSAYLSAEHENFLMGLNKWYEGYFIN